MIMNSMRDEDKLTERRQHERRMISPAVAEYAAAELRRLKPINGRLMSALRAFVTDAEIRQSPDSSPGFLMRLAIGREVIADAMGFGVKTDERFDAGIEAASHLAEKLSASKTLNARLVFALEAITGPWFKLATKVFGWTQVPPEFEHGLALITEAKAAGVSPAEPRFMYQWSADAAGEFAPLSEMLESNADAPDFCDWLRNAAPGARFISGGGAAPIVTTWRVS